MALASGGGKRVDGLLKTQALISSLCFVEIKRHDTPLLQSKPYRPGVWSPSTELVGGVAQLHETVASAVSAVGDQLRPTGEAGDPTGEDIFNVQPRSFLVVGSLAEMQVEQTCCM